MANNNEIDIYSRAELNACALLNSGNIRNLWKKDFRKDYNTSDWDIINSEDIKIEIKSNRFIKEFRANRCSLNTTKQHENIIMKLFIDDSGGILKYKFVKKIKEGWIDITDSIFI